MSYRMSRLANRFACHFGGGGGTTTTNPNIPPQFMPFLTPLIQDTTGRMRGMQEYFWGEGGEGQGYAPGGEDGGWGYENETGATYPGIPNQDQYPLPPDGAIPSGDNNDPRRTPTNQPPPPPPDEDPNLGGDDPRAVPLPPDEDPNLGGGDDPPLQIIPVEPGPGDPATGGEPPASALIPPGTQPPPLPPGTVPWSMAGDQQQAAPADVASMALASTSNGNPDLLAAEADPAAAAAAAAADPAAGAVDSEELIPLAMAQSADTGEDGLPHTGGASMGGVAPYDLSGIGIHEKNPRDVAGASIDQRRAGWMAKEMGEPSQGEGAAWGGLGNLFGQQNRMATGQGMADDAGVNAAYDTFERFQKPMIEDSYSNMGLGRSADKGEALSLGLADMMQPATQDYLSRQTGMIDRDTAIAGQGTELGLGLANQELTRQGTAFDALSQSGDRQRAVSQEQRDAPYNDFMRRAAMGEGSITGPMGGIVPSSIGSQVTSAGGK